MTDLLFWYTGWTVWAAIAVILAIATCVCFVAAVGMAFRVAKERVGLRVLHKMITEYENDRLISVFTPVPEDIDVKALLAFANTLRARTKYCDRTPYFSDEEETRAVIMIAELHGGYSNDEPFSAWLRRVLDEHAELKRKLEPKKTTELS